MSLTLQSISTAFDRRMELRRRMLRHLDISPSQDAAPDLFDDLRKTLLACSCCPHPDICEHWLDKEMSGAPLFCEARAAFGRLDAERAEEPAASGSRATERLQTR